MIGSDGQHFWLLVSVCALCAACTMSWLVRRQVNVTVRSCVLNEFSSNEGKLCSWCVQLVQSGAV